GLKERLRCPEIHIPLCSSHRVSLNTEAIHGRRCWPDVQYEQLGCKINIKNAEKVSTINKAFAEVQKEIRQLSKGTTAEPQKTQQVISLCKNLRMKRMCV
uniref:Uncharacterized protein n=1 Tax=Cyanoderma ruficeps TaxID=181631 RepID=A0A8C3REF2_9PASS